MRKLSKDHLDQFFESIRGRLGWNDNPTSLQFSSTYKKYSVETKGDLNAGS